MNKLPLRKGKQRERDLRAATTFLGSLPDTQNWAIEVKRLVKSRTESQNAYLWGVCYPTILQSGGEALAGWTANDLHEYFLGEHFGWETLEGFGRKRMKPLRRSSKLSTVEFGAYVDSIHLKAAELGIYIPSPNEGL